MNQPSSTSQALTIGFGMRCKAYFDLLKFRLSFLVVFSGGFGYLLSTPDDLNWNHFALFVLGGFLITGASNILNQVWEKDLDKLMKRTEARPLPTGILSIQEALLFASILVLTGVFILVFYINLLTAGLTLLSLVLYAFVYTPLKKISPIAVFVGAFPGALPPLIGWAAATGSLPLAAWIIFLIQFMWQFPHFWAIAWVLDDDYKRAGFKMLPSSGGRDFNTAFQIMIYTLFLIPLGLLPLKLGITGVNSAIITTVAGVLFFAQTFYLMRSCSSKAARYIMFGSFLYLPIVQISFVLDRL